MKGSEREDGLLWALLESQDLKEAKEAICCRCAKAVELATLVPLVSMNAVGNEWGVCEGLTIGRVSCLTGVDISDIFKHLVAGVRLGVGYVGKGCEGERG